MPRRKESKAEAALRNLAESPRGPIRSRRARKQIATEPFPLTLSLFAGEVLELGDLAVERGESTELLAARLLRVAYQALVGSPLGWSYAITPDSREAERAVKRVAAEIEKGHSSPDLSAEEEVEESRRSWSRPEGDPEDGSHGDS